jgi:flagellar biosynthetic protein FliP
MGLAMYLPFVVLLVPLWLGVLSIGWVMTLGHIAMLGTMLLAMLHRRDEYSGHHHNRRFRNRRSADPAANGTTA